MRDRKDRDDRDRKSWREIDQMRGKSRSRDDAKPASPAAAVAQKSYRAALERAFEAGKLEELAKTLSRTDEPKAQPAPSQGKPAAAPASAAPASAQQNPTPPPAPRDPERENRQKMLVKIKETEGREPISRAIDAFLAKYPKLPDDYEVLTKALAHRDDDRVKLTIEQLDHLVLREKPRRARTLVAQLRLLEDTHSDPDVRACASKVRAKL
jgi:hypothetical protein